MYHTSANTCVSGVEGGALKRECFQCGFLTFGLNPCVIRRQNTTLLDLIRSVQFGVVRLEFALIIGLHYFNE